MDLSDSELIHQVETCTLLKGQLTHRNHVRLTWLYLKTHGRAEAGVLLAQTIERYSISVGALTKFDQGLTTAWLEVIAAAQTASVADTFDSFIAEHPELLDKAYVVWPPTTS
jgi:hypothetical protein